jgi:hypothetical protein
MRSLQWRSETAIKSMIAGGQHYHHPKSEAPIKRILDPHSATPVTPATSDLLTSAVQDGL